VASEQELGEFLKESGNDVDLLLASGDFCRQPDKAARIKRAHPGIQIICVSSSCVIARH
jgi:hypothetical protein